MKIAYLTFESPGDNSGVGRKINSQAEYWRSRGNDVQHFLLKRPTDTAAGIHATCLFDGKSPSKPTLAAWGANGRIRQVLRDWNPDVVYMRQLLWWPGAVKACSVAPMIIEFNSIAAHEYRRQSALKYYLHIFSQSFFPGGAHGIISVTQEIDNTIKAHPPLRDVIGNGYDVENTSPRQPPSNERPQLLFVGSPNQPWHGIDKLAGLARLMPDCDFHIVVPGYEVAGPANFICHGGLFGDALAKLYEKIDVAFGTLALHRKHMQEASPLKTREYLAYGIPIIIGYEDPDLTGAEYCLRVENVEDNVRPAIAEIRGFISTWQGRAIDRADVLQRLDYRVKESKRLAFFERVATYGR